MNVETLCSESHEERRQLIGDLASQKEFLVIHLVKNVDNEPTPPSSEIGSQPETKGRLGS